jgi:hypothetical protein
VDRNLLGEDFYLNHRNELLALRMSCLLVGNRVVPLDRLRQITGLHFSNNVYMYLQTAANFALKKYSGKNNSNGTSLTLTAIMDRLKKGSGKYRKMLEKASNEGTEMSQLRVVSTFFRLGNCEIPNQSDLELIHGLWSNCNLTIRIRTFAFQFFNNSVSVANRTAARYQNAEIDQRCVFCVKAKKANPGREDFNHMFVSCPVLERPLSIYFMRNFNIRYDTGNVNLRFLKLTGLLDNVPVKKKFFTVLNILLLNYVLWQARIKKIIPSITTLDLEIDTLFAGFLDASKKWNEAATNSDTFICRRWREQRAGRG